MKEDTDRVARAVSNRERQLKEMGRQLVEHREIVRRQDAELLQLSEDVSFLTSKVKLKDEQLERELEDKETLFNRVQALENLVEKSTVPHKSPASGEVGLTSAYMQYFSSVQVQGSPELFKSLPSFEVEMPEFTPEAEKHDNSIAPVEDEEDIAKELEKMGLSELISKY
jgi:hypothetical protein